MSHDMQGPEDIRSEEDLYNSVAYQALLARAAYQGEWKNKTGSETRMDLPSATDIHGMQYIRQLSSTRRAVYYNKYINKVVITYRGSVDYKDWNTDFGWSDKSILKNNYHENSMYKEDIEHFKEVRAFFPTQDIEVVGHSLGGHRAATIGRQFDVKSIGFNEGYSPLDDRAKQDEKHMSYRVQGDKVSVFTKTGGPLGTGGRTEGKVQTFENPNKSSLLTLAGKLTISPATWLAGKAVDGARAHSIGQDVEAFKLAGLKCDFGKGPADCF